MCHKKQSSSYDTATKMMPKTKFYTPTKQRVKLSEGLISAALL